MQDGSARFRRKTGRDGLAQLGYRFCRFGEWVVICPMHRQGFHHKGSFASKSFPMSPGRTSRFLSFCLLLIL
jgi:hypothetical protein